MSNFIKHLWHLEMGSMFISLFIWKSILICVLTLSFICIYGAIPLSHGMSLEWTTGVHSLLGFLHQYSQMRLVYGFCISIVLLMNA